MRQPVIIAACNEEKFIGRALQSLDAVNTEPLVITNGSTDATADVARSFGAEVYELGERGKLPAIQFGLKQLGKRALEPVLFMDADSYPRFPTHWARTMGKVLLRNEGPSAVAGTLGFCDGPMYETAFRTVKRFNMSRQTAKEALPIEAFYGANMGLKLHDRHVLDQVLAMPHIWPGEDRALGSLVHDNGGDVSISLSPTAMMMTSARYHGSLIARLRYGKAEAQRISTEDYKHRAALTVEASFVHGKLLPKTEATTTTA